MHQLDMTAEDALVHAESRWPGFACWVNETRNPRAPYQVGIVVYDGAGSHRKMMGCGLTWERAFLSADRRAQHPITRAAVARMPKRSHAAPQLDLLAQGCADAHVHRG